MKTGSLIYSKKQRITTADNIKAVIFDLGNVLVDFDHRIAAERISKFTDKNPGEIYNLFFDSGITASFEQGKISPRGFFSEVKAMLNLKLSYGEFLPIWNEIFFFSEKNKTVYEIAKSLKGRYKVALLSNVNILHLEYLKVNFPIFDIFDRVIASCEAGFIKPHPAIYKKALKSLRVCASDAVYTDDRLELVENARGLGIKSFHFQGVEKLKKDFSCAGIALKNNQSNKPIIAHQIMPISGKKKVKSIRL